MTPKKLKSFQQSNYMQLRSLCDQSDHGESVDFPPKPAPEALEPVSEDLLRLVSTILDLYTKGILDADKSLHAIRELVRE